MILKEFNIFLSFVLIGITVGFVFDFFRVLRRVYKTPDFVTVLEDIAFWLISGIILLLGIFVLNDGKIRAYLFLGLFSGICIYIILISKPVMDIGTRGFRLLNKVIFIPIYKIIISIFKVFINSAKFLLNKVKKIKIDFFQTKKLKK